LGHTVLPAEHNVFPGAGTPEQGKAGLMYVIDVVKQLEATPQFASIFQCAKYCPETVDVQFKGLVPAAITGPAGEP
jgi:hypothetical protein